MTWIYGLGYECCLRDDTAPWTQAAAEAAIAGIAPRSMRDVWCRPQPGARTATAAVEVEAGAEAATAAAHMGKAVAVGKAAAAPAKGKTGLRKHAAPRGAAAATTIG